MQILNMFTTFVTWINDLDYTGISLTVMYCVMGWVLYRINKSNSSAFFIDHLFLDENDKASTSKLAQLVVLITSTWAFIHLTLTGKLAEWYFGLYMTVWVLNRGITKWLDLQKATDKSDQ